VAKFYLYVPGMGFTGFLVICDIRSANQRNGLQIQVNWMKEGLLSIIVNAYFSSSRLEGACEKIISHMEREKIPFEIVIVDDGSTDNTFEIAEELESSDSRIRAYRLSRNYTTNYAKFAGLSVCNGDCAVFVPDDLQRTTDTIVKMYRLWQEGHKLVIDYRASRNDGKINDFFSNLYYKIMNSLSDINFPPGGSDGFLADREIIDILNTSIRPINTSIMVEVLRLGFDPYYLATHRPSREGKSRWTLRKKIRLATDTFFTSSSFPIKIITISGVIIFLVSLLSIPFLVYARFFTDNQLLGLRIPGWTTTITFMMLFNGMILFSIGVVAEYIWRIYEEVKDRPGYIIRKKNEEEE
jgi:dolichol-phosphate mannosyltransferase